MKGNKSKTLHFSVPPEKPKIFDERGQEVRLKLGPYKIGDTVTLKCVANGGKTKSINACCHIRSQSEQTIFTHLCMCTSFQVIKLAFAS